MENAASYWKMTNQTARLETRKGDRTGARRGVTAFRSVLSFSSRATDLSFSDPAFSIAP